MTKDVDCRIIVLQSTPHNRCQNHNKIALFTLISIYSSPSKEGDFIFNSTIPSTITYGMRLKIYRYATI